MNEARTAKPDRCRPLAKVSRIANVNQGNPTVPGGGQKGVITMYPLAGGSGVVEIGPNWTWTPPWVNNYVPIN
ncbi:hypothetical protein LAUMK42_03070 [Mycobacterium persicum]|uniref:Uncharacterized protein n=1 Tax=Mycobacterium persicum TaxID=1487726 RepID=A0AB38UUN4_9MYCO|nr:hypothetical protein LAUMK42_03070 [Mycobacterium persicum]